MTFNPFKKKQTQEEQPAREPYFPPDLERFRVRDEEAAPPISSFDIPEKERKFRAFAREMESPESAIEGESAYPRAAKMAKSEREDFFRQKPAEDSDKLDMVLQKLETIDLRLKVIEQKLERSPI